MSDTLNQLIDSETQARVKLLTQIPPVVYGVWIAGVGWLKDEQTHRCFATAQIEVAQTAVELYGTPACVLPFDESLNTLAEIFLQRKQERIAQRWTARLARWIKTWRG